MEAGSVEGALQAPGVEAARTIVERNLRHVAGISGVLVILYSAYGYGLYRLVALIA
jgi:hypothetical protein